MSNDPNYKAIFIILDDIEANGLVHFNQEYFDEKFFKNFFEFKKSYSNFFNEMIQKLDDFHTKRDDVIIFAIYSELFFINSHLEMITKFLKIIINSTKIKGGFDENTPLTQMIKKICNKMQYPEKLKGSIRGLFLLDFENAISSQQYTISKNASLIIYPKDEQMRRSLNLNDLYDDTLQIKTIFDAMIDWSDGQKKPEKKNNDVLNIVKNLVKQVEELDNKLNKFS